MSINHVAISGNLTRDPDLKETAGGTAVLSFGVAVNDRRRDPQTGEWEDVPNFVDCVLFGNRATALSKILRKGAKVAVQGKLRWSQWERDGQRRSKLEVIADELDLMTQREGGQNARPRATGGTTYPQHVADPATVPVPQGQVVAPGVYQPTLGVAQQAQGAYDEDIPF